MDYRIVVDAGHGGSDPGAVNGNIKESDLNLQAALYMYNRFNELGVPVVITRDTDRTLTRSERLNTMNNSFGNDPNVIILSNHINAGGGDSHCVTNV
ncbi:MAG: N-acetylmuramoyl-L-alanine amidase [Bacilli bacterium]|nr:N-acetylmuramoyl-L-alanine amidase [Bacilli bacterium]